MKLYTNKQIVEEIRPALTLEARVMEAREWTTEFDAEFSPFWSYLGGDISIEQCRDDMRAALHKHDPVPKAEERLK